MRAILGLLLLVPIVSGEDEIVTTTAIFGSSVLLPCDCSNINLDKNFKWQMDEPKVEKILFYNKSEQMIFDKYKDRTKVFLAENNNNCSIHLNNITMNDQGKYKCIFYRQDKYQYVFVNLTINVGCSICQSDTFSKDGNFECEVRGRYCEAEIQWKLGDQLLTNSSETEITSSNAMDVYGRYTFTSQLKLKHSGDRKPTCDVKAKGFTTIISRDCPKGPSQRRGEKPKDFTRSHYTIIIPIMLALGFLMIMYRIRHSHKVNQRGTRQNFNAE